MKISLSIIVTTYNWPQALKLVLEALVSQVTPEMEIIIADDGSGLETKFEVDSAKKSTNCQIHHVWQPDDGFQAAKIRNKAIVQAAGEYIIFIDGDCIIAKDFIKNHLKLKQENYFVAGNRVLLTQKFTKNILIKNELVGLHYWGFLDWMQAKWQNKINRLLPCVKLKLAQILASFFVKNKWQGVKTCNLAVWKKDLVVVNGFDEAFTGWGFEDSDLIVRLQRMGIKRKEARFYAPVIHLWHVEQPRDKVTENLQKLEQVIYSDRILSRQGLSQHGIENPTLF